MNNELKQLLEKVNIPTNGQYKDKFYIINLPDSEAYANCYAGLNKIATNTEFPTFGSDKELDKAVFISYYELNLQDKLYNLFLFADCDSNKYYLKIGE